MSEPNNPAPLGTRSTSIVRCCPHRAADHEAKAGSTTLTATGAKCTVPGCDCKGWIPRPQTGRSRESKGPRAGAKIFVNGNGPYPTEWVDGVHRFKANPIVVELLDVQRGDKVADVLGSKGWNADTRIIDGERGNILSLDHIREIYRLAGCSLDDYQDVFPLDKIRYRVTSTGVR